jgi:NAD(P)-dependent dehydrogenase (short-subunit alcohol dehydrogenase family)
MQEKPVALVTGANQGIGLQIAKDLATHGFTVLVGSRNFERGHGARWILTQEEQNGTNIWRDLNNG